MYMYLHRIHVEDNNHNTSHPHPNPLHLICFISFPLCSTTIKTFPFSIYRFTYVSKAWGIEPKDFNAILNKYIEDTTEKGSSDGFTGQLTNIHHNMDSREQFEMLSTVSNYHPLGFPSTQDPQKIKTPNISFHEHIATPEKQRYIPTSPRNRIMYFIKSGEL